MITGPEVDAYVASLIPARSALLTRLEQEAVDEHIPIVQLATAQMIRMWLIAYKPTSILEVGTAIGYSTIWLAEAAPQARIVTLEIDENRASRARANITEAGVDDRVEVIVGDATAGLPDHGTFDCLFIDAAKGQYRTFLDQYLPLVNEGGLLIVDNVLFRGLVTDPDQAGKRLRPMVEKIRDFNRYLAEHPQLETTFVPIGDGVAVSIKKHSDRDS
ncbi:O-methyltransferase [Brevibacillus humidisoli]|uniref:O-methyltransferase n=1 Tax=Brevibacillus humidisoli TaxID=2895522 RepID=UPI001E57A3E7|nr:O-methyltransferase [Brevibacillus humidisoli]UFJ38975.1 O-methyltransferase [Brevibacillus humidisoli]